ncbi:flagellar hook-basal body protein [Paenibacillus sp. NEAU-GSW1]|uniref:flagellar hook-basal body protein n=1 Tax=Paenibacillus sp. NEAU-GSW1 TaxID=2682486 RepID=UPI0012E18BE7|nr:flagellar hook-basal body protein [Paenibacillus sp. NEAU-GSW1]MUT65049.1 flagellar hook-basal body protein [Paenibacillus sp. NEAU-GSW1]
MLRGLYTAAAGLTAQQRRHDTVTNNIANINTPGYKQTNAVTRSFPEMLLSLTGVDANDAREVGRLSTGVFAEESLSVYLQGDLMQTNRSSDFALVSDIAVPGMAFDESGKYVSPDGEVTFQPQAFFTLQNATGETRYTRGGSFMLDSEGFLVTGDGSSVVGANGQPIQFPPNVSIDDLVLVDNNRFINAKTGEDTGVQLLLTRVDNPNQLAREGNGNYRLEGDEAGARPVAAGEQVEIRQGFIERSNVDAAQSSVDLMSALRAYEANQKIIQAYDESLDKAVNQVGRI